VWRVARGGCWDDEAEVTLSEFREYVNPPQGGSIIGFRIVRP